MSSLTPSQKTLPLRSFAAVVRSGLNTFSGRVAAQALTAASAVMMLGAASASAADANALEGYWLNKAGDAIVEVGPCSNSHARICGTVVWASNENTLKVGERVLTGFRVDGNKSGDRWTQGKVSLKAGKKAQKGKLYFADEKLKVGACRGSKCKNVTWTRPSATMTAEAGLKGGAE